MFYSTQLNSNLANKSFVATLYNTANISGGNMYPLVQHYNDALVSCSGDNITLTAKKNMNIVVDVLVANPYAKLYDAYYVVNNTDSAFFITHPNNRFIRDLIYI